MKQETGMLDRGMIGRKSMKRKLIGENIIEDG